MNQLIKFFVQFLDILLKSLFICLFLKFKNENIFFRFLKNQIDDLFSREKILIYLMDIRTKVLWPDDNNTFIPMKHVKHRAYNACMNKIPSKTIFLLISFILLKIQRMASTSCRCRKCSSYYY